MKLRTNLDVRAYAVERGVTFKEVADKIGIHNTTFSVMYMRNELPEETKTMLKEAIDEVVEDRGY